MSEQDQSKDHGQADLTAGGAASGAEVVLRLEGVRKSFGGTTVLDGIDLDVARDEVVALIGASGSGKSTLLRTVNLLEQVDDGRIVLGGEDITDPRVRVDAVRARIGVVFQHYNLFPHLTVLDNVSLASRHVLRQTKAAANERALEVLTRVGLGDKAGAYPDRLSGGQQQRVAIARAIAKRPDVMLCDEPTGALDSMTGILVLEALERVNRELRTTTAVITHNAAVAAMADRVATLADGQVTSTRTNSARRPPRELEW